MYHISLFSSSLSEFHFPTKMTTYTFVYRAVLKISDAHERILEKGVNTCLYTVHVHVGIGIGNFSCL